MYNCWNVKIPVLDPLMLVFLIELRVGILFFSLSHVHPLKLRLQPFAERVLGPRRLLLVDIFSNKFIRLFRFLKI